jgi:acetyl-CoA C-acetyltransferase
MGDSIESYYLGERELFRSRSSRLAAERAYKMASISDPAGRIDVAEISARFAHQEPIICEALGLFPEGSGAAVAEQGLSEIGGETPVSPSGGALGAYPFSAAGVICVAECFRQLTDSAGDAQVANASTAVAHGQDGFCAQHNAVIVLSREGG